MNENSAEQVRLYTLEEAAEQLRVSREWPVPDAAARTVTVVKFGRRTLVEPAELDRVIAAARTNSAA
ncbi:DNA-binding protein [Mycobacteroides salmoniphilum]|uniref:DNA-binding protein n=1 Tax=Mycobacteroides salmoniphilum TaxID=404941 RepID=UPI001064CC0F|nr:DNA-binding protein [Mycobacteroides salmoniphilum]